MRLTKQQFIDRLPDGVFVAILQAAKVSVDLEAWLFRFNAVTPETDGTSVDLTDPRTIAGVHALAAAGLMTSEQADAFLGASQSIGGFTLGQMVRVKAPFDAAFPDVYAVTGFSESSVQIDGRADFAPDHLEAA
jgi:hypothetical protein